MRITRRATLLTFSLLLSVIDVTGAWYSCVSTNVLKQRVRVYCRNYCCGNETHQYCCNQCRLSVYRIPLCVDTHQIALYATVPIFLLALAILIVACIRFGNENDQDPPGYCFRSNRIGIPGCGTLTEPQPALSPRSQDNHLPPWWRRMPAVNDCVQRQGVLSDQANRGCHWDSLMPPIPQAWLPAYMFPPLPKYESPDRLSPSTPPPPFEGSQMSVRTPTHSSPPPDNPATGQPSTSARGARPTSEGNENPAHPATPPPSYETIERDRKN